MLGIDVIHLFAVATGNNGCLYTNAAQFRYKLLKASNIFKVHINFKLVEFASNVSLLLWLVVEIHIINLYKSHSLHLMLKTRLLRIVFLELATPKYCILWLGIEYHAIKVEQCYMSMHVISLS